MLIVALAAFVAELDSARIQVRVEYGRAEVTAAYQLATPLDSIVLVLIRLPGQAAGSVSGIARVEPRQGLIQLVARPDAAGLVLLRYEVQGELARIPLPVPSVPVARGGGRVEIRIAGLDPGTPLSDAFPRFRSDGDRALASLANVPSLVRIPDRGWSLLRALDLLVVGLVASLSLAGIARVRRRAAGIPRSDRGLPDHR